MNAFVAEVDVKREKDRDREREGKGVFGFAAESSYIFRIAGRRRRRRRGLLSLDFGHAAKVTRAVSPRTRERVLNTDEPPRFVVNWPVRVQYAACIPSRLPSALHFVLQLGGGGGGRKPECIFGGRSRCRGRMTRECLKSRIYSGESGEVGKEKTKV